MPRFRRAFPPVLLALVSLTSTATAAEPEIRLAPALEEEWNDNARGWPYLAEGDTWSATLQQGSLVWVNREPDKPHSTNLQLPLSSRRNYEIALEARLVESDSAAPIFGFQFGGSTQTNDYHAFLVGPDGSFRIETFQLGQAAVRDSGKAEEAYRQRGNNTLSLRRIGEETAFFLNGVCVSIIPTLEPFGPLIGPYTGSATTAAFDSLRLGYLRGEPEAFAALTARYRAGLGDARQSFLIAPPLSIEELAQPISIATTPAAPEVVQGLLDEARALAAAGNPDQAANRLRQALASAPEWAELHALYAQCALSMGQAAVGRRHADLAILFDPLSVPARDALVLASAAEGKAAEAQAALALALFLDGSPARISAWQEDCRQLAAAQPSWTGIATLASEATSLAAARSAAFDPIAQALRDAMDASSRGDAEAVHAELESARNYAARLPTEYTWLATPLFMQAGQELERLGRATLAQPFLEAALVAANAEASHVSAYVRASLIESLAQLYLNTGEAGQALSLAEAQLTATLALPDLAEARKSELLRIACESAHLLNRYDTLRRNADALLARARASGSLWHEANALNFAALSYMTSRLPPERQRMRQLLEQAAAVAERGKFTQLQDSVQANLAVSHYQAGDKAKAKQIYQSLADKAAADNRPLDAELHLNNMGAMSIMDRDYAAAAAAFQQSVAIIENHRSATLGAERIRFLELRRGNYQFLAQCQAKAGQSEALFRTQNAIRARVLAEELMLDEAPRPLSLRDFQASLSKDEAAIFYTLGGAGNVVIQVVTQEGAYPVNVELYEPFIALKAAYLDQMRAGVSGYKPVGHQTTIDGNTYVDNNLATQVSREDFDQILEIGRGLIERSIQAPPDLRNQAIREILSAFQKLLIEPIAYRLAGKTKLILFPDDVLYFLPFEALPLANGRYLAQDYEVRYAQSAEVREILRKRVYPKDRLPFLAMGGAIYERMSESATPLADETRHIQLKIQAATNASAGKPQREVYAALFAEPMSYLQGTLVEVLNLSQLFPEAKVFTGTDMTENRIKEMSESGELARFRIVHLATHGFALPEFPQLSGLAMCIFSEMQGGEDGYLTAPEIARLRMAADLAVLSACQTGLGRIYGGEGVAGLTSSILVGGANRALVTLWPVNDAGAMHYMTGLYQLVAQQGLSLPEASAQMKRRFIAGEFGADFQDPEIWAPFVLYGP